MKSLNKHVPLLIFLFGLACMAYSMLTFFHPDLQQETAKPNLPPGAGEIFTPTPRIPVKPPRQARPTPEWDKQLAEQMHKVADGYLKSSGLEIQLPPTMQYADIADGNAQVLIGSDGGGRIGLYLFTGHGAKFNLRDHVQDALKDLNARFNGKGIPYTSRVGVTMASFKGQSSQGVEYFAYFFKGSRDVNYAFVLADKQLGKHPAAVREMVESIRVKKR